MLWAKWIVFSNSFKEVLSYKILCLFPFNHICISFTNFFSRVLKKIEYSLEYSWHFDNIELFESLNLFLPLFWSQWNILWLIILLMVSSWNWLLLFVFFFLYLLSIKRSACGLLLWIFWLFIFFLMKCSCWIFVFFVFFNLWFLRLWFVWSIKSFGHKLELMLSLKQLFCVIINRFFAFFWNNYFFT